MAQAGNPFYRFTTSLSDMRQDGFTRHSLYWPDSKENHQRLLRLLCQKFGLFPPQAEFRLVKFDSSDFFWVMQKQNEDEWSRYFQRSLGPQLATSKRYQSDKGFIVEIMWRYTQRCTRHVTTCVEGMEALVRIKSMAQLCVFGRRLELQCRPLYNSIIMYYNVLYIYNYIYIYIYIQTYYTAYIFTWFPHGMID